MGFLLVEVGLASLIPGSWPSGFSSAICASAISEAGVIAYSGWSAHLRYHVCLGKRLTKAHVF